MRDQEAETQAARLLQAVQQRDLHGLAQRPLLLTVMSWLHTFRGQLPEDRTELYADAVDLLLRRWEGRVGGEVGVVEQLAIPGLKMSDLEAGLYAVAFKAHSGAAEDEGTADIDEADLRKWLAPYLGNDWNKAGEFITYIRERAGLLVRHKHDAYTFPHRTFQEFMAACYLVGMDDYPSEAAKLVEQAPDRWREVFTLASGSAARTHRLGQAIAAVNALCPEEVSVTKAPSREAFLRAELAGTSLLEIGLVGVGREPVGRAALERMRRWLAAALRADHVLKPVERAEAGNVLAKLNDPRFRADAWFLPDEPLLGFVEIPQDAFRMGEGKEEHKLELPIYYIGRYPVTVAQFGAFVEAGGYREPHYWKEAQAAGIWQDGKVKGRLDDDPRVKPVEYGGSLESANHPVVGITWYEMVAYCRWLTEQLCAWQGTPEPLARLLRKEHWEVQLPSEAQWEKAARGTDGRVYPWVSDPDPNRANYDKTGIGATSAVGCFPGGRSPYDVEDLSGNVWEWTRSLYRGYPYDPKDGREVLDAGSDQSRVLRGGAFSNVRYVRCAWRNWDYPGSRSYDYGFRLVLSPYL
jgi:formylglycine-generating enzyme required for sulfatase activity